MISDVQSVQPQYLSTFVNFHSCIPHVFSLKYLKTNLSILSSLSEKVLYEHLLPTDLET